MHLTPDNDRIDFYVGPFIALVNYGKIRADVQNRWFTFDFEDDTAAGIQLGADIGKGPWAFHVGLRYIETAAEEDEGEGEDEDDEREIRVGIDPVIATVGFSYRF